MLFATCYLLLAAGCLLATRYLMHAACCFCSFPPTACYMLLATFYRLHPQTYKPDFYPFTHLRKTLQITTAATDKNFPDEPIDEDRWYVAVY